MDDPYLGEIRLTAFPYAPNRWALCNGQLLPIAQNQALFALLGTTYGGNGATTFALPNFQGRMPMHSGVNYPPGTQGGASVHSLTMAEMPQHTHLAHTATTATTTDPSGARWASPGKQAYVPAPDTLMSPASLATAGGSQPHNNMSPYLALNFVIALQGAFPSAN